MPKSVLTVVVIPLTTSGLHCGADRTATIGRAAPEVIPLTHERAPLRQRTPARSQRRIVLVIPLTTSGLHCGGQRTRVQLTRESSSRSPRAGSIAAGLGRSGAPERLRSSSRSLTSGLHCGGINGSATGDRTVIPLIHERAPLRQRLDHKRRRSARSHPAHPRAGSIAATLRTAVGTCGEASSRSPRAGSIAATAARRSRSTVSTSHPAHSRAGSIAASTRRRSRARRHDVIPLTTSGLHCGAIAGQRARGRHAESSRSLTSGLHCGGDWPTRERPPRSSRSLTSGLHCGAPRRQPSAQRTCAVIPLTTSGLHCGRTCAACRDRPGSARHPAHSRAGSIAAATGSPHICAARSGHPAHHERAPLRQ